MPHVPKKSLLEKGEIQLSLAGQRLEAEKKFDAKMLARTYTKEAVATLVGVMQNEKAAHADRIAAAKIILERGHGKAPVMIEDGNGVKMPVVFLPMELNEEKQTITVQGARVEPEKPKELLRPLSKAWYEETDQDASPPTKAYTRK